MPAAVAKVMLDFAECLSVDPTPEILGAFDSIERFDHFQKRLLQNILGEVVIQGESLDVRQDPVGDLLRQLGHSLTVAALRLRYQPYNTRFVSYPHIFSIMPCIIVQIGRVLLQFICFFHKSTSCTEKTLFFTFKTVCRPIERHFFVRKSQKNHLWV